LSITLLGFVIKGMREYNYSMKLTVLWHKEYSVSTMRAGPARAKGIMFRANGKRSPHPSVDRSENHYVRKTRHPGLTELDKHERALINWSMR